MKTLLLLVCLLAACTQEKGPEPEPHAIPEHSDEPEHEQLPNRVHLAPEVVEAAKVKWAPAQREALEIVVELPGELVADPDRMARIVAPAEGRIERVAFREGDVVKKGEVLAVLRLPELPERRAAVAALESRMNAAKSNAERLDRLAKKGLAAEQEATSARAEHEALSAEARAASEQLGALGSSQGSTLEVRAPIAGTIIERSAVIGDRATSERPLATIVDLSTVWFLGRVFERDLVAVKSGARAEIELNAYPGDRFSGAVEYVAQQIDPVARTVVARIVLHNEKTALKLGLFGTARVAVGKKRETPAIVVPRSAVTDLEDRPVVFVRQADGDFERHDIVLGAAVLGQIEVLSGLREGELVVTEGVFTLKSTVLKQTFVEEEE